MSTPIDQLLDRARAAEPNDRIDMRDEIAGQGADAIEAMGEWLADPIFCRFAVRVIGRAADLGARDPAIAKLLDARNETTPAQRADIDAELNRLGVDPARKRPTRRRQAAKSRRGSLRDVLYVVAQAADPRRQGMHAEDLWDRISGLPEAAGRDATSVASALNVAHDLFERVPDQASTFRWLVDARPVHDSSEGALSGRRLAVVAYSHARGLDPQAQGMNYQKLTGSIVGSGDLIAGVDWGAAVNKAVSESTDLFERIGRGMYRWRHAPLASSRGWMMRTNRDLASWIWSEVEAGRLRQGWGSHPERDLNILRDRRERGEPFDEDDDLAWDNRRMLTDEPDGMQIGDLILTPHLPSEWRWSVVRVVGPYRYEIHPERRDYGHVLPVMVVAADIDPATDPFVLDSLRDAVRYPARLMRMDEEQVADLHRLVGD